MPDFITETSPIRRHPIVMAVRQQVCLDGIAVSIDAIELAYERLLGLLLARARLISDAQGGDAHRQFVEVVTDCWGIVDWANRLRVLLDAAPGFKKRSPGFQLVTRALGEVEPLRNAFQHIDGTIEGMRDRGGEVVGTVRFVYWPEPPHGPYSIVVMVPTSRAPVGGSTVFKLGDPSGRRTEAPVGLVTLAIAEVELCLSDLVFSVRSFRSSLHDAMLMAFSDIDWSRRDQVFRIDVLAQPPEVIANDWAVPPT